MRRRCVRQSGHRVRVASIAAFFFFNDTATTETYTLSLHDALPISTARDRVTALSDRGKRAVLALIATRERSEEHTSELQSRVELVCRLLLEKKTNTGGVRRRRTQAGTKNASNPTKGVTDDNSADAH